MKPQKIEIKNLFKYSAEKNVFKFKPDSLTLIIGPNGAGKSSIFEAISFALFEQTVRWGLTKKEILRRGAEEGYVIFFFEHDGNQYEIKRSRTEQGSGAVSFYCHTTSEHIGKSIKDTNEEIVSLVGFDFNAFRNSVLFGQHDLAKVVALRSKDRLELLSNFLGLGMLDKGYEYAHNNYMMTMGELKVLDCKLDMEDKILLKSQVKKLRRILQENKNELIESKDKFSDLKSLVKKLERMQSSSVKARSSIRNCDDELDRLTTQKKKLKSAAGKKKTSPDKVESLLAESSAAYEELEGLEIRLSDFSSSMQEISETRRVIKETIRQTKDRIAYIRRKKTCTECGREYTKEVVDDKVEQETSRLTKNKKQSDKLKGKIDKKEGEAKKIRDRITEIKSLPHPDKLEVELAEAKRIRKIGNEVEEIEIEVRKQNARKKRAKETLEAIKAEGYSIDRLDNLKESLIESRGDVAEAQSNIDKIKKNIKDGKNAIEKIDGMEEKRESIIKICKRRKFVADIFSKTGGVRQVIIENVLPVLNTRINGYMDTLSNEGISVEFTTGVKTKKGKFKNKLDILILSPEGIADFDSYSGGEKQTIILAIGLGISELAAESVGMDCEVLLLDEVFGALDIGARNRLLNLMHGLQKKFGTVIAISHIKELKAQIPDVVTIKRIKGFSRILQK